MATRIMELQRHEIEITKLTPRVGEDGATTHTVFSARWIEGEDSATFHAFKLFRSSKYGWHTKAGASGTMDVGDVLAEAGVARRKGLHVFAGPVVEMEIF